MRDYITYEARIYKQHNNRRDFDEYCYKANLLLAKYPYGVTIANVQRVIGLSYKTAKAVLNKVATEKDGRFFKRKP